MAEITLYEKMKSSTKALYSASLNGFTLATSLIQMLICNFFLSSLL